jgi:spermidine synthase
MVLGSAGSMALEIVAGRLMAPYVGMSLYSWTAIIAVVLAGLSAGHWLGGLLADRPGRALARATGAALLVAALGAGASLAILRATAGPILAGLDPVPAMGAIALAAFFLPSLAAGVIAPLVTRLALDAADPGRRGRVLGAMFALGAVGAILGTVAAGFWLVPSLGSTASVMAVALAYAALAVPYLAGFGRALAGGVAGAAAFGLLAPGQVPALASPCLEESAYFCVRIDPMPGTGGARVMALDHLVHGVNDPRPGRLHAPYAQLADEIVRRRVAGAPSAFFVGGGAYTLPRAWAARHEDPEIVVAEIDPAVTRIAEERLWVEPDRFEIHHMDARLALSRLAPGRRFDVIFGDAFHDVAIPAHLVTDEFHALVKRRLRPGGLYMVNVVEARREPPFLLSFVRTLKRRFAHVELWLDTGSMGPGEARVTWLVVASDRPSGLSEIRARHGFARTWLRVPTEAMLSVLPREAQVVLTDDHAPVARLMRHVITDRRLAE